jgi:DNA-binding NarL/FixJ family response regulator
VRAYGLSLFTASPPGRQLAGCRWEGRHTPSVPLRLMIVDDHADVRYLIRALLEEASADLVVAAEAASGEAAILAIDAVDPDLVVLDALMPVRDGFQTAELILARRPEQRILLCTAVLDDAVRERAAAAGITACVAKDAFDDLAGAVLAAARGES